MKKKRILVMSSLLVAIILLGIGTVAYIRRSVGGVLTGSTGNLVLIVNEANAVRNESFSISLNRSTSEPYVMPDDSGSFNINIDSTGSSTDVEVTFNVTRTNLPDNLKFYTDSSYTTEITAQTYKISHGTTMTKTIPVYWFWDGSVDDENDTLFMGASLSANILVTAQVAKSPTFYEILLEQENTLDTSVDFGEVSSVDNGQGLMMHNGTESNNYPVLYYRGDVSNNNVIFVDKCWLIVRTTETGGIKLVFNGPVVENGDGTQSCTNYSGVGGVTANSSYTDVYAGNTKTAFNTSYNSPVYVGYMYNDEDYIYSKSTLTTGYVSHLLNNNIDSETGRHVQNLKDSTIKGVVDDWYETNILGKTEEDLLEDAVWCNDRSLIDEKYTIENYVNGSYYFAFASATRLVENEEKIPSLVCSRDMDKFTVDSANGNGDLDYPIGLLTADETWLAGNRTSYLSVSSNYWTLSPYNFGSNAYMLGMGEDLVETSNVNASRGARPSISLKNSTTISGGNGSFESPYLVG